MFVESNIPYSERSEVSLRKTLTTLFRLDYDSVVLNSTVEVKQRKLETIEIKRIECDVDEASSSAGRTMRFDGPAFRQYTRLTILADESISSFVLSPANASTIAFDIVAIKACNSLEVDLISLDMSQRLPFALKHHNVQQALKRGIYFEVCYGDAIRDSTSRRHLVCNATQLVRATKGKNIILSAGLSDPAYIRGPYDVMNLAMLFGLNSTQAHAAISTFPRGMIVHGESRRKHKSVIDVRLVSKLEPSESWKVADMDELIEENEREEAEKEKRKDKKQRVV